MHEALGFLPVLLAAQGESYFYRFRGVSASSVLSPRWLVRNFMPIECL